MWDLIANITIITKTLACKFYLQLFDYVEHHLSCVIQIIRIPRYIGSYVAQSFNQSGSRGHTVVSKIYTKLKRDKRFRLCRNKNNHDRKIVLIPGSQ
jgi:hypothetical protein